MRRLAQEPWFTLATVGTLALGIAATTALFTAVNAALLRPLPFPQPQERARPGARPRPGLTGAPSRP